MVTQMSLTTSREFEPFRTGCGAKIDDTKNDPWRWTTYISHCAVRWMRDPHKWTREDTDDFYDAMTETAAICAAAAESVLRQRNKNGRTFYEPGDK